MVLGRFPVPAYNRVFRPRAGSYRVEKSVKCFEIALWLWHETEWASSQFKQVQIDLKVDRSRLGNFVSLQTPKKTWAESAQREREREYKTGASRATSNLHWKSPGSYTTHTQSTFAIKKVLANVLKLKHPFRLICKTFPCRHEWLPWEQRSWNRWPLIYAVVSVRLSFGG